MSYAANVLVQDPNFLRTTAPVSILRRHILSLRGNHIFSIQGRLISVQEGAAFFVFVESHCEIVSRAPCFTWAASCVFNHVISGTTFFFLYYLFVSGNFFISVVVFFLVGSFCSG